MAINKYFLYSRQQENLRSSIDRKMGKTYYPGYVVVNGTKKPFTQISDTPTDKRFADAIMVAYGDINMIHYVKPYSVKGVLR